MTLENKIDCIKCGADSTIEWKYNPYCQPCMETLLEQEQCRMQENLEDWGDEDRECSI